MTRTKQQHEHSYKPGRGTVDVCACGKFRHNERAGDAIVEQTVTPQVTARHTPGPQLHGLAYWQEMKRQRDELLAALLVCEDLLADLERGGAENPELEIARAAIARARGQS